VLVDRAASVGEHRTVAALVVAEYDVAIRAARCREEKLTGDVGQRVGLVGRHVDELRGRAARRAPAAGHVDDATRTDGAADVPEPRREVTGGDVERQLVQSVGVPTGSAVVDGGSVGAGTSGRENVRVVPPGSLVAQMRPPWASMIRLQM
jgi:hypothetical protein